MSNIGVQVIRRAVSIFSLLLETVEIPYYCLILARNHKQYISAAPELGRQPGKSDLGSNALDITLIGPTLHDKATISVAGFCELQDFKNATSVNSG